MKSCGGPNDHLKNVVMKVTPDPPVKGGTLTIQASGTLDEAEGAFNSNVDLNITALGIVHVGVKGGVPMTISPGAVAGPFSLTVGPFSLPSNIPGSAVVKGQVHVTNAKNEPIMCIDLDLDVPAMDDKETSVAPQIALTESVEAPALTTISSCGKATDHIPDFNVASSSGVITMTGTLDEAVTKASIDLDVSLKVLVISLPLKMTIPLTVSEGLIKKGAIKATVGPSTIAVSPDVKATIKGTVKMNDGNSEEITCLNVDTVVAADDTALTVKDDCQYYRKVQDPACGDICLPSQIGVCPRSIVVSTGGLEAGKCADKGYTVDKGEQDQEAGPCGTLKIELWAKADDIIV